MKTIELEKLIVDAIENIETKKAVMVSTFKEEGVLTTDRGLVVRIGDDEFEITIVRV
jgi:hypothetical protein